MPYKLHPFCAAFRRASASEKAEIVAGMKMHGYDHTQPITLYGDAILDGKTREDAAIDAGVEPAYTAFTGTEDEAMAFVIRRNKARKHMTRGELDLAAARLVEARRGGQKGNLNQTGGKATNVYSPIHSCSNIALQKTREMVAKEIGRSTATIANARSVLAHGAPNIIAAVEAGQVSSYSAARAISGKTKDEQANLTADGMRKNSTDIKNKRITGNGRQRTSNKSNTKKSTPRTVVRNIDGERWVKLSEITKNIRPISKGVMHESKQSHATISRSQLLMYASLLDKLLQGWSGPEQNAEGAAARLLSKSEPQKEESSS